jgi:hypothetical protein
MKVEYVTLEGEKEVQIFDDTTDGHSKCVNFWFEITSNHLCKSAIMISDD